MADTDGSLPKDLYKDDGYRLTAVACFFSALCITVVTARFYATRLKKAHIGPDDWMCIPALVKY
ncbi:hypothetical protein N7G274_010635 [Stereocaulon virgatum]|uniref:CASP-like protein n=1 Tax=Stereocaulon virgatum TaxID=373712 RepID=A0ABR3ZU50_9LECA